MAANFNIWPMSRYPNVNNLIYRILFYFFNNRITRIYSDNRTKRIVILEL